MPALHLFNRRTYLGGDDLQPSSLLTIFVRSLQLFGLILPLFIHIIVTSPNDKDCNGLNHPFPLLLFVYTVCSLSFCLLSAYMEWKVIKCASIGTPTQPGPRLPAIQTLLEWKLGCLTFINLLIVSFGGVCIGYGQSYYATYDGSCNNYTRYEAALNEGDHTGMISRVWLFAPILLFVSQSAELLISILGVIRLFSKDKKSSVEEQYDADVMIPSQHANHPLLQIPHTASNSSLNGSSSITPPSPSFRYYHHQHYHQHHHHELVEEMWSTRCQFWCKCASFSTCYFFGGRNIEHGDYGDISRVLADYFEHNGVLDLVPSDLMVGFGMLHRIQKQRILEARKSVLEEKSVLERGDGINHGNGNNSRVVSPDKSNGVDIGGGVVCNETLLGTTATITPTSPNRSSRLRSSVLSEDSTSMIMTVSRYSQDEESGTSNAEDSSHGCHDNALSFRMTRSPRRSGNNEDDNEVRYEASRRSILTKTNRFDLQTLEEGARYSRFALAIYTWVLYVYMNPMTGLCSLGFTRCRRFGRRLMSSSSADTTDGTATATNGPTPSSPVIGDNCFGAHHAGLLSLLDVSTVSPSDVRYVQLESGFSETPYCIVIDHKWSSVVVSIRGTLSLEDCIVDVLVDPESLEELGREFGFDGEGQFCHAGVLDCTRWIYDDLQRHGILEQLLLGDNAEFPNYKLRIVGHSLGAGCAVLLSCMMRRTYPNLRCLSYSPPGMFITWKLATECRDFVTSFVLDSDFIPRLSVQNMEHLRNEVLELIGRIKVPKIEVIQTLFKETVGHEDGHGCGASLCCCSGETHHGDAEYYAQMNDDMLHPRDSVPQDTAFARKLEQFKLIQSERKRRRGELREVKMYPPGRIVHLVKIGQRKSCLHGLGKCITCGMTNAGSEYTPIWAENDDFNEVVMSPTMWTDHFPNRVCLEIEKVATEAFGLDISGGSVDHHSGSMGETV
uniref:sn-1-specific diacylglycerol lipase n=1 Tax=Ditylum brightwellii TaxID=49249 RepID=A0A7S4R4T3_9STRA